MHAAHISTDMAVNLNIHISLLKASFLPDSFEPHQCYSSSSIPQGFVLILFMISLNVCYVLLQIVKNLNECRSLIEITMKHVFCSSYA